MSSALAMHFRKIADKFHVEGNEIMVVSRKATNPSYIYRVFLNCCTLWYRFICSTLQENNIRFWQELREDYDRLCNLCYHLDAVLSDLILLSYANNLSFILVQLFNSLKYVRFLIFLSCGFCKCFSFQTDTDCHRGRVLFLLFWIPHLQINRRVHLRQLDKRRKQTTDTFSAFIAFAAVQHRSKKM